MDDIIDGVLNESLGTPVKKGKRWYVTVARPGRGTTGNYSDEVLKQTGPAAFPPGTKAFFNHDMKRDVRDMVGTYKEGAFWNEEAGELGAYLTPFPRYEQVLDEAAENIEASVHSAMRIDTATRNIKELVYNRSNTVDLVSFAGLEGSGLKYAVESLFAAAAAEGDEGKEKKDMDIEQEIGTLKTAIENLITKFDTFANEKHDDLQGQADEAAVNAKVATLVEEALSGYAETEQAIESADILKVQKDALKARARKGEDVSDDLAAAVEFANEARKELVPDVKVRTRGNVVVVANESFDSKQPTTTKSFKPGHWSSR